MHVIVLTLAKPHGVSAAGKVFVSCLISGNALFNTLDIFLVIRYSGSLIHDDTLHVGVIINILHPREQIFPRITNVQTQKSCKYTSKQQKTDTMGEMN